MEIVIDTKKTIESNAEIYFEKSKKAKKKIEGVKKALIKFQKQKKEFVAKKEQAIKEFEEKEEKRVRKKRVKKWYEKFRWFISSEGFLCIGGRDATTNEIVVKKHTEKGDIVFHTELPGSPFFVVKSEGKKIGLNTIKETAQATASYSRAWKMGLGSAQVFYVNPDQLKKDVSLPKGSFIVHGKRNHLEPSLEIAVGMYNDVIMGGPVDAIKKNCAKFVVVVQGRLKKTDVSKKIQKTLGGELDDINSALPAGGVEIK